VNPHAEARTEDFNSMSVDYQVANLAVQRARDSWIDAVDHFAHTRSLLTTDETERYLHAAGCYELAVAFPNIGAFQQDWVRARARLGAREMRVLAAEVEVERRLSALTVAERDASRALGALAYAAE
jgi:hypothetical protein